MEEKSIGIERRKGIILPIIGGIILIGLIIVILLLSVGRQNQTQSYEATLSAITALAEDQSAESAAVIQEPTATMTAIPPTEAPTMMPAATATEITPFAISVDGLQVRCLDFDYDLPIDSIADFKDNPKAVNDGSINGAVVKVIIPVKACAVFVTFTQEPSDEISVDIYQSKDPNPWYSQPFVKDEGTPNTYYAILKHPYIIDPPYWNLEYGMKVNSASQTYWEGNLSLSRVFSGLCWEGSVPDPVTLKCPDADKLEREPHPDMPTLVPGGIYN